MFSGWTYTIIFSTTIAMQAFIFPLILGPCLLKSKNKKKASKWLEVIIGFPAGAFLGNAMINLAPEIF